MLRFLRKLRAASHLSNVATDRCRKRSHSSRRLPGRRKRAGEEVPDHIRSCYRTIVEMFMSSWSKHRESGQLFRVTCRNDISATIVILCLHRCRQSPNSAYIQQTPLFCRSDSPCLTGGITKSCSRQSVQSIIFLHVVESPAST